METEVLLFEIQEMEVGKQNGKLQDVQKRVKNEPNQYIQQTT